MRKVLELTESGRHTNVTLDIDQARWLHTSGVASVSPGREVGSYDLQVGHVVGALSLGDLQIAVRPKLPVRNTMWLLALSGTEPQWSEEAVLLGSSDIVEVLAQLYIRELDALLQRGLVSGYRRVEATDVVLRGRLRMREQFGRRFGQLYPLDIEYDEFDRNTTENQMLLTAALVLEELLQSSRSAISPELSRLLPHFAGVEAWTAGVDQPTLQLTRLNVHYSRALEIASLILDGVGVSEEYGVRSGQGIIFPMWKVFERFVARVLASHFGDSAVDAQHSRRLFTDGRPAIQIRPDIVLRSGPSITAVIDTKYKTADPASADLYQMSTYASVLKVPDVTLLYAEPIPPQTLTIAGSGARIHLRGVDLSRELDAIVEDILAVSADLPIEQGGQGTNFGWRSSQTGSLPGPRP